MKALLFKMIIGLCNSRGFNALLRRAAASHFSRRLIPLYIRYFQIDLSQVKKPPQAFSSLNDFFIRELVPDARPIDENPVALVSPVDARLALNRPVGADACFEVKGQKLSLSELLGSETLAQRFSEGHIMVLYLSPADYHRIHAPWSGSCLARRALGRKSWPVNDDGLRYGERPLCTNYRIVHEFAQGCCIFVGATNVNSIVSHAIDEWTKGREVGYFQFGSTVVLLFEKARVATELTEGTVLRMGERIARFLN